LGQFFVAWLGQASHFYFWFEFRNFPLKIPNFNFFPSGEKSIYSLYFGRSREKSLISNWHCQTKLTIEKYKLFWHSI